jgi:uncharacterized damage-inducible protein DinB
MKELRDAMQHMAWADAEVWRAVRALPAAETDAPTRERLHHVHEVQWAYLQIWRGEPVATRELTSFSDLAAIEAWGRDFHREVIAWLEDVERRQDWGEEVRLPWADQLVARFGAAQPATISETVLQVTQHSAYHRGQINARLRELGGEPPLVDFIVWIWRGRPAA